jgi:DNA-binding IclR family transcriptional regulator
MNGEIMVVQKNKSIEDVLNVLLEIAGAADSWGSRELARRMNMEPTRINRFLRTLSDAGFLVQDANRKYYSGAGMEVLAAQAIHGSRFLRCALPVIETMDLSQHIIALGTLHRDKVCYLYHVQPGMTFAEGIGRCNVHPASTSSIGLVMLAELTDDKVRDIYDDSAIVGYFQTVDELLDKLNEIRQLGYCVVESFPDPEYYTMAATVGSPAFGALALSYITKDEKDNQIELLQQKAAEINKIMEQEQYVIQR